MNQTVCPYCGRTFCFGEDTGGRTYYYTDTTALQEKDAEDYENECERLVKNMDIIFESIDKSIKKIQEIMTAHRDGIMRDDSNY